MHYLIFVDFIINNLMKSDELILMGKGSGSGGCLMNNNNDEAEFIKLPLKIKIKDIDVSGSFVIAIDIYDDLYIWGTLHKTLLKQETKIGSKVELMSAGWNHCLFANQAGLWGLGNNQYEQLGLQSEQIFVLTPVLINNWIPRIICCGFRQSYCLVGHSLYGCGQTKKYELGIASTTPIKWKLLFEDIQAKTKKIQRIVCGKRFVMMLNEVKEIWGFGYNEQNVFNKPELKQAIQPVFLFKQIDFIDVGWSHVVLGATDGLRSYGKNNLYQLGREQHQNNILIKQEIEVKQLICGTESNLLLTKQNRIYVWGWNQHQNIDAEKIEVIKIPKTIDLQYKVQRLWTNAATTLIQVSSPTGQHN